MIPGSRYKFRIKSENNYGISEPGDESDPFDVGGASADRYENKKINFKIHEICLGYNNQYLNARTLEYVSHKIITNQRGIEAKYFIPFKPLLAPYYFKRF